MVTQSKKLELFVANTKKMIIAMLEEDINKKKYRPPKYIYQSIPIAVNFEGKKYRFEASGLLLSIGYLKEQLRKQIPGIR